jgi:hypothetical protein
VVESRAEKLASDMQVIAAEPPSIATPSAHLTPFESFSKRCESPILAALPSLLLCIESTLSRAFKSRPPALFDIRAIGAYLRRQVYGHLKKIR